MLWIKNNILSDCLVALYLPSVNTTTNLGSISAALSSPVYVPPRTAAGNRAYDKSDRLQTCFVKTWEQTAVPSSLELTCFFLNYVLYGRLNQSGVAVFLQEQIRDWNVKFVSQLHFAMILFSTNQRTSATVRNFFISFRPLARGLRYSDSFPFPTHCLFFVFLSFIPRNST